MEEGLIKRLMTSIKCSACGCYYDIDNISILGHRETLWFVKARCSSCHTQCLVAAVIKEDGVPEVITDLAEAELDKFKDAGVLTVDEVLDMHIFLKDFDGDFSRLFRQN